MQIFGLFAHGLVAGSLAHFKVAKVVNEALGNKDAYNHGVGALINDMKKEAPDLKLDRGGSAGAER